MSEHRPDVKGATPREVQHITAECRSTHGFLAWDEAVARLNKVYAAQVARRPGATVSLAIYVTDPSAGAAPEPAGGERP